jgi:hypothetical protein
VVAGQEEIYLETTEEELRASSMLIGIIFPLKCSITVDVFER